MDDGFIRQLVGIKALFEQQQSLEGGLRELACRAAHIIGAQRCSVMLLSEGQEGAGPQLRLCSHFGELPEEAYRTPPRAGESVAWHVVETGIPLLVNDIEYSPLAGLVRPGSCMGGSMMSAPVLLSDRVVGVINVSLPEGERRFEPKDLELLGVFALFVGQSIQVFQLQRLSESRVLQMARLLEQRDAGEQAPISPDPARIARIVAKTFYRELRQAGFGTSAIITVATEVLGLLEHHLDKHRARADRHDES